VCTCYGVADIESTADPNYRETVESKHHDEPRYVYATGDAMIAQSTMQNHSDDELVMLEWLCGREVPFDSDVYR
jgi:hypothetical protein